MLLHLCRVPGQKSLVVKFLVQVVAIKSALLRLEQDFLGFVRPVESEVVGSEIGIGDDHVGVDAQSVLRAGNGRVILTQLGREVSEIRHRDGVIGIALGPELIDLRRFFYFTSYGRVIHGRDAIFLAFADFRAQTVSLSQILRRHVGLVEIAVRQSQAGVGCCESWIELEGTLVERNRRSIALGARCHDAHAERLQRFEGRSGCLHRNFELLHRGQ